MGYITAKCGFSDKEIEKLINEHVNKGYEYVEAISGIAGGSGGLSSVILIFEGPH